MRHIVLAFLPILLAAYSGFARAACIQVPRDSNPPLATACETRLNYDFTVAGTTYSYDKSEYQSQLHELLGSWLETHDLDSSALSGAAAEIWLAVPEVNPEATQLRVVVQCAYGSFVAYLSLHPEEWSTANLGVSILPEGSRYPDSYGFKSEDLLVKGNPNVDAQMMIAFLTAHSTTAVTSFSPGWYSATTAPFNEEATAAAIMDEPDADTYVARITFNQTVEWIATRERAFVFSFRSP